jgi:hypothetical protein
MIFGKKSDLKNHLSLKHPTFTQKVIVRAAHEQTTEMETEREMSPDRDTAPRAERSEATPFRS